MPPIYLCNYSTPWHATLFELQGQIYLALQRMLSWPAHFLPQTAQCCSIYQVFWEISGPFQPV
jgi:hypothetical protein